ncbi:MULTISPECIES: hypothetical protein [unclassified Pantoea]|uniref:hypothetical protein n=1 Tax=unclassified Pantoea TaxID=2630326 RepID=UPI001232D849|nr:MULTISPECIES: hypothetical protein [unclassified Pantoea]KAA5974856.1 hypothetical protein F3I51_02910 [Pantoea sp. M_6]KAA5979211.1 hypothetical protein F3I52_04475 [Pantoea sp. M_8]KAA5992015.1 hypothetical protein F3I47_09140 [Pantoea sp. M_10]
MKEDYLVFSYAYSGQPMHWEAGLPTVSILESENPRVWKSIKVYRMKSGDSIYNVASEFGPPHQNELDAAVAKYSPRPSSTN